MKQKQEAKPVYDDRAKKFQAGFNPCDMSDFERRLVIKEVQDRKDAHNSFTQGIQGRDGGSCPIKRPGYEIAESF